MIFDNKNYLLELAYSTSQNSHIEFIQSSQHFITKITIQIQHYTSVAVFLVPDWGMKLSMATDCRNGPLSYKSCRACTRARRHAGFIP
jgi:hypothetical protein